MAEDIHFTIGYDNSRVHKAAAETVAVMDRAGKKVGASFTQSTGAMAGGNSGMYRLGQASQQFQDIAVQLQGGTKFATVLAQQGSQLASIFGPGGMIAGGLLAVGGALAAVSTRGARDMATLADGVKGFNAEIAKAASGDDIATLVQNLDAIARKKEEIMGSKSIDFWGRVSGGLMGQSRAESRNDRENQTTQQEFNRKEIADAIVRTENQRARYAMLIAEGRTREAAAYKRSLEEAQRIEEIEKSNLLTGEKTAALYAINTRYRSQDKADAQEMARAEKKRLEDFYKQDWQMRGEPQSREAGRVQDASKGLRASQWAAEMANSNDLEKAELLRAQAVEERQKAMAQGPMMLSEELALQTRINELLTQAQQLEQGVADKDAAALKTKADEAARVAKDAATQKAQHEDAAQGLAAQMAAQEAKLSGHKREAKKITETESLRQRTNQIANELGIDPKDAAEVAAFEKKLSDDLAKKAAGKIRGAHSGQTRRGFGGLDERKFEGLDALRKLQDRNNPAFGNGDPLDKQLQSRRNVLKPDAKQDKPNISAPGVEAKIEALTKLIEQRLTVAA